MGAEQWWKNREILGLGERHESVKITKGRDMMKMSLGRMKQRDVH